MTTLTPENIKFRIARALMASPVGLLRKSLTTIINTGDASVDSTINEMIHFDHIKMDGNRLKITPIGRAHYAETIKPSTHDDTITESEDSEIEPIAGFRTSDGVIHMTKELARIHQFKIKLDPDIERFIADTGIKKHQRGIVKKVVLDYEQWRSNGKSS